MPAAWRSTASPMARSCATATFKRIWIQPAAGDAGGALGAALAAYHIYKGERREIDNKLDGMSGAYLGPAFDERDSARRLAAAGAVFARLDDGALIERTARRLWRTARRSAGSRAAWNSARARSATVRSSRDPRSRDMQKALNLKVKYRESLPAVRARRCCASDVADWFDLDGDSPYMLLVADVVKRRQRSMTAEEQALFGIDKLNVRALRHSGRDPRRLFGAHPDRACRDQPALSTRCSPASRRMTGCPVLVNTSFNVRGEPIVCTPEDAFRCFMGTELEFARGRQLVHGQGRTGPRAQARLQGRFRARLTSRDSAPSASRGDPRPGVAAFSSRAGCRYCQAQNSKKMNWAGSQSRSARTHEGDCADHHRRQRSNVDAGLSSMLSHHQPHPLQPLTANPRNRMHKRVSSERVNICFGTDPGRLNKSCSDRKAFGSARWRLERVASTRLTRGSASNSHGRPPQCCNGRRLFHASDGTGFADFSLLVVRR